MRVRVLRPQEIQTFPSRQKEDSLHVEGGHLGLRGLKQGYSATFQSLKGE